MRITVAIPPAESAAPPIVEPLLTSAEALAERGRQSLYETAWPQQIADIEITLTDPILKPGSIVEVEDISGNWNGKITSVSILATPDEISTQSLTIELVAP